MKLLFVDLFINILIFMAKGNILLPIVKTSLGELSGTIKKSAQGRDFYAFEGVPFAKPPIGDLRFREPQDVAPWNGTLEANTVCKCLQYFHESTSSPTYNSPYIGSEDCLYLNIYTPNPSTAVLYDVIVFIHGGAFMFNFGAFQGPEYLLDRDVVYVNFNYRLGPFGFLSTEDDVVPGNNGLKDQIQALEWVQRHIRHFGGNARSVTIAGNSAGGASVQLHYLMSRSKGLFQRGISQSGCALNPWVLQENALEKTRQLAASLQCNSRNTSKLIACLRRRSGQDIVERIKEFQPWLYNPFSPFGVVVDVWAADPLLVDHPVVLLKRGRVKAAPWLVSHTNSEGLYPSASFYDDQLLGQIDSDWNRVIPHILDYNNTIAENLRDAASQKIRRYYFEGRSVSKETFANLTKMISDRLYIFDLEKAISLQSAFTPTYYYFFTYRGAFSRSEGRARSNRNFGAAHGDDMSYILKTNLDMRSTADDKRTSEMLVNMWVTYARDGVPQMPVKWKPVAEGSKLLNYLKIESPTKITTEAASSLGNRYFWKTLPFDENELVARLKDELVF